MFKPTQTFLQQFTLRITLFIRPGCSLCTDAKKVLSNVWDKRPFEFDEVDVMQTHQRKWRDVYEFDTPVIHIDKTKEGSDFSTTVAARKLMHRFKEEQVEKLMDETMMAPSEESPASSSEKESS